MTSCLWQPTQARIPSCLRNIAFVAALAACRADVPESGVPLTGDIDIGRAACAECVIELSDSLTIGGQHGWDVLSEYASVGMDRRGNLIIADFQAFPNQVVLFNPASGKPPVIAGKPGDGPGEIRQISNAWMDDDGLHIFDGRLMRETVFDSTGAVQREYAYRFGAVRKMGMRWPLPGGKLLVNATIASSEAAGYPLHVLDAERNLERSFGADTAMQLPGYIDLNVRSTLLAADGGIWQARGNEYRIEKWTMDGRRQLTLTRRPSWFEPWSTVATTDYMAAPPPPRIAGLFEDAGNGLLWVVILVPDENYRPTKRISDPETPVVTAELGRYFDTVLEVIDIRTGRLVKSHRFDEFLGLTAGLIRRQVNHDNGSASFTLSRMSLSGYP